MQWQAKSSKELALPNSWLELPARQQSLGGHFGTPYSTLIQQTFAPWLPKILGYQILKIGGLSAELGTELPLRHQILLCPDQQSLQKFAQQGFSLIQASLQEFPFVEQSIDACFLIQTLNFCADPHQLLREVQRVLTEDGYLFISLFNPLFPLNWQPNQRLPFACRVRDWLELLNFEIIAQQNLGFGSASAFSPLQAFSPIQTIVAQKRPYAMYLKPEAFRFPQPSLRNYVTVGANKTATSPTSLPLERR